MDSYHVASTAPSATPGYSALPYHLSEHQAKLSGYHSKMASGSNNKYHASGPVGSGTCTAGDIKCIVGELTGRLTNLETKSGANFDNLFGKVGTLEANVTKGFDTQGGRIADLTKWVQAHS